MNSSPLDGGTAFGIRHSMTIGGLNAAGSSFPGGAQPAGARQTTHEMNLAISDTTVAGTAVADLHVRADCA